MMRSGLRRKVLPALLTVITAGAVVGCSDPPKGFTWGVPRETLSGSTPINTSVVQAQNHTGRTIPDLQIGAQYVQSNGKTTDYYGEDIDSVSGDPNCHRVLDPQVDDAYPAYYVDCGPLANGKSISVTITFNDNNVNDIWIGGPKWSDDQGLTK